MQVLIVQFVDPRRSDPQPKFSHCLGVLASMLDGQGIAASLLTVGSCQPARLHDAIIASRPRWALANLGPHTVTTARRTVAEIAQRFSLPVAVFGQFATALPQRAISMPGVRAAAIGEYEHTLVEFLAAIRDGLDPANDVTSEGDRIEGLWLKTADGLVRGPTRRLHENLDDLPFPARDLFDHARIVDATGEASFQAARGCPMWCGYCLNDSYLDLYEGGGQCVRRRSVENLLDEIEQVRARWNGIREISFRDHSFAMNEKWLARFAEQYPRRCGLPFRCHVRLKSVTSATAAQLAEAGCRWVHTVIGSGSRLIREEVQAIHAAERQMVEAVRDLRDAGLRVAARVFVGNPYESEVTVENTLALVRKAGPDEVHPVVYYPTPGTRAAEICADNGWISGRGEENFWTQQSVLDMESFPADRINETARKFSSLLKHHKSGGIRRLLTKALWGGKGR